MTDYRGLGFDPVPGDAGAVAALTGRLRFDVDVPTTAAGWTGGAAEGFTGRVEAVVAEVTAVRKSMLAAAEVLDDWATTVLGNQRRAEELDGRAARLRREVADAVDRLDDTGGLASFTAAHAELHRAALAHHDEVRGRLDAVLEEARDLEREHHARAREVAERLGAGPREHPLSATLDDFAALTAELASVLLGQARPHGSGGAAAAFAAGLG
ncbi:hypothetical protein [Actinosynnema sp. NPDC020468]|uniref:hypothetical protein n=1 Tax=Actinosynnema sp. NPDC020468 TaxID=3154488 RepID=UPI0033D5116E